MAQKAALNPSLQPISKPHTNALFEICKEITKSLLLYYISENKV
jgi:hypothetical protein